MQNSILPIRATIPAYIIIIITTTIIIIIIIDQHSDKRGSITDHEYHAIGSREGTERRQFMYRDKTNVEHEMCDSTGKNTIKGLKINL
jgi:hypothetical protein